jgi:RimJ/RimL family protein N-acetyltransferase
LIQHVDFPHDLAQIPSNLMADQYLLRPLRTTDVELDYDAVMSSRAMLRAWSQSSWPAEDFTLQGNLDDLERHQREHEAGEAYTFTVMNLDQTRCLGCVYINPLPQELLNPGQGADQTKAWSGPAAFVRFWVRRALQDDKFDLLLLRELVAWFQTEWPIDHLLFRVSPVDNHQQFLFTSAGHMRVHRFLSSEGKLSWLAFR